MCAKSYLFVQFKYSVYGRTGHTYTRVSQCSRASVGLAQVRPNYSETYTSLYYSSVWSPNSYLLQCFQALVHLEGISQCSGSLRSNFIVAETVEEKSIIIHVSELSCDNGLLLIVGLLANQVFRNQSGNYKDHTGTSITTIY